MNITLSPQLEEIVRRMVESGGYDSPEDVIRQALELLDRRDKNLAWLRKEVQKGLDQLERGEYTVYDEQGLKDLAERVKARGRERLKAEQRQQQA
jgi:antitoxin ParD1/3/4